LPDLFLDRLTPGLAALLFLAPTDTDVAATVDGPLYARATARRLATAPLETLDEQLGLLAQLPEAIAITALTEALADLESGRPDEKNVSAPMPAATSDSSRPPSRPNSPPRRAPALAPNRCSIAATA
jgi:hypothetical protein